MKKIPITQGQFALVSDKDYDKVRQFKWQVLKSENTCYAIRNIRSNGKKTVGLMHRLILDAPPDKWVDHKNGNGLDNRRENMRYCTPSQNQHNQLSIWGTSKFKGVYWSKSNKKWCARIRVAGKLVWLGSFNIEEDAAKAYDSAAVEHFSEFARTNKMMELL